MNNGTQPSAVSQNPAWSSQSADAPGADAAPYPHEQLEAMRASPEPEQLVPVGQSSWAGFNSASSNNMLVFEPSPTDASSGPDIQRSTPLSSGSPGTDSKDAVVWGLMSFADEQRTDEPPHAHVRKDSQHELQSSLNNMELDVPLDGRRPWSGF